MAQTCEHVKQIKNVKPHTTGCEECLKMGDHWVHLRLCLVVRARGLLRQLEEQTRHQTLPRHAPPDYAVVRAGRGLEVVLRR